MATTVKNGTGAAPAAAPKDDREAESGPSCFDKYIDLLVDRPHQCFSGCCALVFFLVFVSSAAGFMTPDTKNDSYMWQVPTADQTKLTVAWAEAGKMLDDQRRLQELQSSKAGFQLDDIGGHHGARRLQRGEDSDFHDVLLYYKTSAATVFTPQSLKDVCELEKVAAETPGAWDTSVLRFFYGSCHFPGCSVVDRTLEHYNWGCSALAQVDVDAVVSDMLDDVQLLQTSSTFAKYVDRSFVSTGQSQYTSSTWTFPSEESQDGVRDMLSEMGLSSGYSRSAFVVDDDQFTAYASLRVRMVTNAEVEQELINQDFGLAAFAMIFVMIVMIVHTRSCWVGSCGMWSIIAACPIASIVYQGVFQIKIFSYVHMLIIFVILGVGADDVFVLVDAFKNTKDSLVGHSERMSRSDVHRVLKHALWSSSASMLNTSLTTAVAFLTNSVSPIAGIRTMGWFAGLSVFACYFLTITFTAAVLVIYHYRFENKRCCCPHPGSREAAPPTKMQFNSRSEVLNAIFQHHDENSNGKLCREEMKKFAQQAGYSGSDEEWATKFDQFCTLMDKDPKEGLDVEAFTKVANDDNSKGVYCSTKDLEDILAPAKPDAKRGFVQNYILEKGYIRAMSYKIMGGRLAICPLIVAVLLAATSIQGVVFASQLGPESKPTQWVPDNHMFTNIDIFASETYFSPQYEWFGIVYYIFGIEDLDLSVRDTYAPQNNPGAPIFDSKFDLSTVATQNAMLQFCDDMQTMICTEDSCDNIQQPTRTLKLQSDMTTHSCFLQHFKNYSGGVLPTGDDFYDQLRAFRSTFGDDVPEPWSSDAIGSNYVEEIGFIGGELKYVAVKLRTVFRSNVPFTEGKPVQDRIEEWTEQQRDQMPTELKSLKMMGEGYLFASYDLGSALIDGFFAGVAIASPIVFIVLVLSTRNLLLSLYAVLSVGSIVMCVLGFCKSAMDWDLGIAESIAGVIVIGYSVDYVLHLAHMYKESAEFGHVARVDRANYTIRNLGTTVFAGAITTGGAGSVLFGCYLLFFHKMALLIVATIVYSLLFSIGFFMSLLYLAGPEGTLGELPDWCSLGHCFRKCCKGRLTPTE